MATIKGYTDFERSQKLAEILPAESADMHFERVYFEGHPPAWFIKLGEPIKSNDIIPCWSLAALLDVLPRTVRLVGTPRSSYWYCECVDNENQWYAGFGNADTPIDACVEMILKLHEQNIL